MFPLAALVIVFATPASPASRGDVVILRPVTITEPLREAAARLTAELQTSGFAVRVQERYPYSKILAYEAGAVMALTPRPLAAISIYEEGQTLGGTLWRIDPRSEKPAAWLVTVTDDLGKGGAEEKIRAPAVLAVRAVELLHASLTGLELDAPKLFPPASPQPLQKPPQKPPPKPPPKPPIAEILEISPKKSDWLLAGGAAVLHSFASLGTALLPELQLTRNLRQGYAVRARVMGLGAGTTSEVTGTGGRATLKQDLLQIDGVRFFEGNTFVPFATAGLGMYHAAVSGTPLMGFEATDDKYWGACGRLGLGARLRLSSRVSLTAEGGALFVWPALRVSFNGMEQGTAGRPSALGSLALQVDL